MSTPEEMAYFREIFMRGFILLTTFNLIGMMVRIVRTLRRPGSDFNN